MADRTDITELLLSLEDGESPAVDALFPSVYHELRGIAGARLRSERPDHTLSATSLVHEAYLKLVNQEKTEWKNRAHFFAIAARAMRRILMDHAVARNAEKRGGGAPVVTLMDDSGEVASDVEELLAIDQAMQRLEALDARQAKVVELRFFGGLRMEEIAEVLGVSLASANRDWRTARAFLTAELRG